MQCMEVWGGNRGIDTGVEVPGLEGWVLARPHAGAEAGGDIHYVSSCATGRITRLLLADVSGHGSGVDSVAVELRNLMRRYVNMIDQRALVRSLNREFGELARDGMFATAVAATYFAPARRLVISNAGHPRPLVFRAREQTWSSIGIESAGEDGPANLPLGVLAPTSYDERAIALVEGDLVVFYSDSLIEARNAQGRTLGEEGLVHRLRAIKPGTPEQVARSIVQGLDGLADDDVTLVTVPGALETPQALQRLAQSGDYEALVALGAVIRGETYHFEIVSDESARGIGEVALQFGVPIGNGVLTCDTDEQALARMDAKGREAALAALELACLFDDLDDA